MVTSAPSRAQTEASSSPMAPPPTTARRCGTASKPMAWSEETTVRPSNGRKESSEGAEPVARTMFFAAMVVFSPPRGLPIGEISMVVAPVSVAWPVWTVIWRALASWAMPPTSF